MAEVTWSLEDLKQTLEYLKNAVKSEREERKVLKTNLEKLSEEVSNTEKVLKEKIHSLGILSLITQDLDHKVRKVQLRENSSDIETDDRLADSRSLFILEQKNSKLTETNSSLEKENEEMLPKIQSIEKQISESQSILATSDNTIKDKIEVLKAEILTTKVNIEKYKLQKVQTVEEVEEKREKCEEIDALLREKNVFVTCLEEKHSNVKKEVDSSKEYEKEIVDKLANHIKIENEMAADLLRFRSTVAEARSSYQKFYVKRIWMLSTTNVTLILRKGEDGKHVLQTIDGKKVNCLKVSEVDAVFMHPTKPNRFFIRTCGEQDQEYESESAVKIMGLIRELVFSDFNGRG